MPYATLDDILSLLPESSVINLTDDSGAGVIDQEKAAAAIAAADAEIDGYLAVRYAVPIDPVPAVIRKCSADIAVYNLYSRYAESIPEARKDRYKNCVRLLENIAKGVAAVGGTPPPPVSAGGGTAHAPERIFSAGRMESY